MSHEEPRALFTIDLSGETPLVSGPHPYDGAKPIYVAVTRQHEIVHHFLNQEWFSTSIPNLRDNELDEENWASLGELIS